MTSRVKSIYISLLLLFISISLNAQTLILWKGAGNGTAGDGSWIPFTNKVATVETATSKINPNIDLTKSYITVTPGQEDLSGYVYGLQTKNWPQGQLFANTEISASNFAGKYIEFVVQAMPGFRVDVSQIKMLYNRVNTQVSAYAWEVYVNDETFRSLKINFSSGLSNGKQPLAIGTSVGKFVDKVSLHFHLSGNTSTPSPSAGFTIDNGTNNGIFDPNEFGNKNYNLSTTTRYLYTSETLRIIAYAKGTTIDVVNTVLDASITKNLGSSLTISPTSFATDEIWMAPSGTTTFVEGPTMTKVDGTATSIPVPTTTGQYKLYVKNTNATLGWTSAASTATVTVQVPPRTITVQNTSWGSSISSSESNSDGTVVLATEYVEDNQVATLTFNGQNYTGSILNNGTSMTIPASVFQALSSGTYPVTATVSDLAGTVANYSGSIIIDKIAPTITVSSSNLNFGSVLNNTEKSSNGTLTVNTSGAENGQVVSVVLNSQTYTGTVSSNTATITIPSSALSALSSGNTYSITTNVSDAAGNPATQNSFDFSTDFVAPTLSTVSIVSNNTNTAKAKAGDVISLSLTASESIATPTVTIAGQAATVTGSGVNFTASYTVLSTSTEGNVAIAVSCADLAGNSVSTNATTNSSTVLIDRTKPTLSAVTISSNNTSSTKAKVGDVITVAITSSETISTPTVRIAGQTATVTGSGTSFSASYTVTSSTTSGTVGLIVDFSDLANNAGTQVTSASSGSVVVDLVAPTGYAFSIDQTSVTNANKAGISLLMTGAEVGSSYSVNVSDGTNSRSGLAVGTVINTTQAISSLDLSSFSDGTITISVVLTDPTGNVGNAVSHTISKDTNVPSISSVSTSAGTYYYNSNIDISVATSIPVTPVTTAGTPTIDVTIGSTVRQAVLVNTSASSTLTFRYTVQSSDVDADGISIGNAIILNGGTLKNAGGNDLILTLNNIASTTSVLVDGVPGPALTSLALVGASSATNLSISYTATFDHAVTGVTTSSFATSTIGIISGATITSVTGSGANYTINLTLTSSSVSTGTGTVYLFLKANQTSIVNGGKPISTLSQFNGNTYTYTPPVITIPAPTIGTTSYLIKTFPSPSPSTDRLGLNFPITLPAGGTLPSGTNYLTSLYRDAEIQFSYDGSNWTTVDNGNSFETFAGVAYKYIGNGTSRSYQLLIVPISPAAPTIYIRARTKVEDSGNGTIMYSDWTTASELFNPPAPTVSSARLMLANGVYNVEIVTDMYDPNQTVVSFERKYKLLGDANFTTVTIPSSDSGPNTNGYVRGGGSGKVYTNYNTSYDLNLTTGNVYQFEVTPIFANSVRGTTYVFNQYLSNGTNSVTGTPLNHAIAVNVDLSNVLAQVSGATLVSTRYQFGLFTAPSTLSNVASTTIAGTNASTILSSNSNGALVNGSTYRVLGTATLSASGVNFSVSLAPVDVIPNPPALTITGLTGVNKEYDGNRTATTTGTAVLNGVANGHTVTLSGTPVFQFADATIANGKAITVTGYTLSGANAGDYSLVQPTGLTANITPKALTITGITGTNKTYDGLLTATLTGTAALSGVVGSESVTLNSPSTFNFASAGVGNGIAISPTSNYTISGTDAANYTLTQPSSLSANITQKGLTISGLSAANKEYNGNTNVDVSGTATYVGLQNGESFAIVGSPTYAFADANVGNNKAINTSGFLAPSANYSISQPALTASITGKALSVTATGPIMTVGTALTTGLSSTNFTASGTIAGEAVTSVTLTPNAAGLSASSPSGTTYTVTPSLATGSGGFLASNYIITYNAFTGVVAGPPVVSSINRVSPANTNQITVNYTVTFDKAVTGVDVSDFQVTSTGATTATIASISGSAATYTVVLNTISGDGTIRLDLKSSGTGIQDVEGRAIVSGFTSGQVYSIDQTQPTLSSVTISSNNGSITSKAKVGDIITLSLTASESIATPSVTIAGQSATVTGTGGTYTATYTVATPITEGPAAISINYSDLAGNAGTVVTSTTNSSTVTVDVSNPTISSLLISSSNANTALAKVGDVITLTLTASESIATPSVSIAGGTVSMTGSGGTYTATYTVTSSTPQGTASISVNFADISGNAGTTVTSTTNASSVVVDRTAPTMSIVSNPANLRSGQASTLTFTISESVSDFVASDITISGGSIGTFSGTGTTYTAEFTPSPNSNANGVIDVAVNKFTDAAGNANTAASNTVTISIDNSLPTVTITSSITALKAGETATITFTFSEAVLGFDLTDVTMNNGTLGTLSGTGSSYTATFTPNANVEGTSSISIGATTFTDLAGNDNGVTASLAPLNIDTQVPSIGSSTLSWGTSLNNSETGSNGTVTLALTNVENGRTVTVAVNSQTYTATVSSNAATITIPSSRLAALTDGGTYTVTTNVSDAAGNAAPAGTVSFTVDKTLPTITSVTTSAGTVINATEAASAATVTVNTTGTENGQVVSVVLNSQTYSATVSSNVATITIPASALTALTDGGTYTVTTNVSDAAANAANQNSFSISVDKTKPTTTISSSAANLKIGQSATLTITLSEAATDFVAGDITIAGGTIGTLSGTGRNYSATFTPTANYEGTASITLASNQFTDPNGNPNDESSNTANAISIAVDTKAPTMTIASNPANLRSGQSATLTFTISEAVSDFVAGDITISGGSIGTLSGTGTTYTAEFTPTANSNANGVIDVAVNKFTDAAGNANTSASNTVTISIDNTVPTVAITSNAAALKAGETATITFTFSEAVLGFDLTDVTVNNGALGTLSGTGSVYTAAFTPNTNVEGTSTISLGANTFTDLAGNNNAVSTSLAPLNIDTKVPSIGSSTLSWGTSLNSAETATNGSVTLALTNVEDGRTVSVSVNSQTYTATVASNVATVIIPAANLAALSTGGTYTVTTNVSDAAGNAAPAGTSTFTVDKTAPTLSSVIITSDNTPANLAKSGNTITLSITASESIQTPTVSIAGVAATVSGSGTNYTATYPVIATSTSGAAAILISYSDVAGNPGVNVVATTNSSIVTIDRTAPSMTILSSASTFKIGTTATIRFTASEATMNFIQSDVTVTGGTLTNWTAVSSTVYTATFTPNANTALNGNLSVAASKFSDAAGNNNVASNNVSFIIDTFRPTVALSSNVNSVNGNQTATINFTFNESVSGFTASDIVVTNGSLGALTGSGSAYSSVFTPAANFNGSATISVASNTFSDTVGNSNTDGAEANNTYTLAVDSGIPALSSVGIQSSNADPTLGNIGDVISINFVSTETVNTPIVTIDGQSAYVSGDGTNWTASYVVINGTNDGPLAFTIDYTDVAGNAGATVSTPTDGSAVSVLKNQTPVDNSTDITLSQDAPDQSINLLAGITDPEGDPLTVSNVTISYSIENVVTNQPVVINSTLLTKFQDVVSTADLTGTNLFIEMSKSKFLNGSQKGQINIAYVVTDGNNSLNANAVLNIIGANDQPTGAAVTLNQVVINGQNMGIPLTEGVGVSTNVPGIDPDDDSVTYTLDQNSSVSNGQFVFNPDGSFNFLPNPNYYGEQEFDYYIKDQSGVLNGPYKVKIIIAENPDIDGIPSKLEEVAPNGGDVNGDGIPDRKQNNITNVPLGSFADYQAGIDWANGVPGSTRPSTSKVGSLLIGSLPGGKSGLDSLDLDPNAKFRNVALLPTPNIANTDRQFSSDLYQFTIEGLLTNAADTLSPRLPLRDLDPTRPGLQVRAVLEFPVGMKGSTYLKQNKAGEWKSFKDDQNLATYDDGATLIDLDNDPSTIERIVLTFTDGAFGDKDTLVNNSISDPGGLGIIKPVIDDATLPTRAEGVATATALFNVFDQNSRLDVDEEGQKLYYTIDSTNNSAAVRAAVKIDSLTGVITVRDAGGFDYESFVDANGLAQFRIVVKATDTDGNFDLATYIQTITNVDEYPRIISGKTVSYREKQPTTVAVIRVQTLPDYQDLTSFSILPGLDGSFFTIDPATGVLRFKNSPNYDDKPVYTLDIQSQDLSGKTDHAVFTVNIIDIDADNDGILDDEEIGPDPLHPIDTDKDGIPDYLDTDSDGDGIPDLLESKSDTDKDGIPDYLDTDSDGDGILDKIEAGPNPLKPLDSDGDGIPDFREIDADNDGYLDSYEKSIDTDKDGIPDFQDTDSDGDGILDKVEDDLDFGNIKDCDHDGIENRIDPDVCDLILPQIITPNGDGLNDVLKIPGIMRLQPNHITIINRWGAVVYDAENYQNTWGGTGDSGELPDGTYYYVVDFKGAKPTISNFIYLDRTGK